MTDKWKIVLECLNKISQMCPEDNTLDQCDESESNVQKLTLAEIGDTAREAIQAMAPTQNVEPVAYDNRQ